MTLNLSREAAHVLSEALSQYVENNENALHWFSEELNPHRLPRKNELAEQILEQVNLTIANPKEQQ